ncbi:MAG TPA: hypothetical protein VM597_13790 [Gemmataceae bacterium]|nr:hypothetical protein [Gemmataceae bacterium]
MYRRRHPCSDLPTALFDAHDLGRRVYDRGGNRPEVRFDCTDREPLLPVLVGGTVELFQWGSRDRAGPLPTTPWTWRASVDAGAWAGVGCDTEACVIPARYGFERGVWFLITEGIHGLLVRPPETAPAAYMVCEPSTRYYRVMTRSDRMPWLVGEVI